MAAVYNSSGKTAYGAYSPDGSGYEPGYGGYKRQSPIIKWYDVKMSYEEKARFNLLTYQDYIEWQKELVESANSDSGRNDLDAKTFWTNDTEERINVSNSEYEAFLSENNIDVTNRNNVDFGSLASQVSEEKVYDKPIVEETEEEILARVTASNSSGDDRILTDEEIAALFAAAANN